MPDMDPPRAGPSIRDVLTRQDAHRSSLLWDAPSAGEGKHEKNWAVEHRTHIAKWAAHATIADAPPFHGEMSYNDNYMVWFRPRTVRHITRETSYWDTLVESQLRIMEKCEPGSEIYNDCINALRAIEELGRLTLDDARTVGNTSEPAVGRGRQAGRRQRQGGRQSSQRPTSSRRQTPGPTSGRR
nr:hypothetical protein CFP56_58906 [Quercus suber]